MAAGIAALPLAMAGCATLPAGAPPQPLAISTLTDEVVPGPILGWGTGPSHATVELPGVECTATNDRGSWTLLTPGVLEVQRSGARLRITCRKEGFRDSRLGLPCVTPRSEGAAMGAYIGMQVLATPAVVLAPAAAVAAVAGVTALGIAAGSAARGLAREPDVCVYGGGRKIQLYMTR